VAPSRGDRMWRSQPAAWSCEPKSRKPRIFGQGARLRASVGLWYPGRVVAQATIEQGWPIFGRESELAQLEAFVDPATTTRGFFLTGEPGAGKTTLWEAAIELARRRGLRVLSARASGADTQLAFTALIDLFDDVTREDFAGLPPPQRRALEVALLRAEPGDDGLPDAAVALGFTNVVRGLAEREPLLLAVDDVQWLDAASAEALVYAIPRLVDHPVRFLFAKRSRSSSFLERAHGPKGLQRLEVGPLTFGATQRLLAERLGLSLPRHVLRRVVSATLGNALFALELGRVLGARGTLAIGEDVPMPEIVEEILGTRVAGLPANVRRLLLAVALSGDLRATQVGAIGATPAVLDEAVEVGVLRVDGERLRPAHPLFAAAAKSDARAAEQRQMHQALAEIAVDEESRAVHRALAADEPDEELAADLSAAAHSAAARGARHDAVVLAEHALRLTPPGSAARVPRLLDVGDALAAAGERRRITRLIEPELEAIPDGTARVRASLLLTFGDVQDNDEIRRHMDDALAASAGDVQLRAQVLMEIAENEAVIRVEQIPRADAWAREALETVDALEAVNPKLERHALYTVAWTRALRGEPVDDLCERFVSASEAVPFIASSPERVAAQRLTWRGENDEARAVVARLRALADENGESHSYALQRLHLCQLELRIGNCEAVELLLDEWARSREQIMWPMYERCRALHAAVRGAPDEAEQWAEKAVARAVALGAGWDRLEALRARGVAALLLNEAAAAAESLRTVWEHTVREGIDEPGVFPVAPELVEALVELRRLDEADGVTERLRGLAVAQAHPWGLATVARCEALIRIAREQDVDAGGAELVAAAESYAELGLRFDRARTLLSLGRAQRRQRKWGAARDALEQAATDFDELGAVGWAQQARDESSRVGGRRPSGEGQLTPAERRVVELAADGLSNKEIARDLVITVRTVEAHLKNAYAKLGVRSRTQLARRLLERA
jgi:DNA-binding CsgD family transcriptional regulator